MGSLVDSYLIDYKQGYKIEPLHNNYNVGVECSGFLAWEHHILVISPNSLCAQKGSNSDLISYLSLFPTPNDFQL